MMSEESNFDFTVSAPGKIILFGEHSVVYKKAAVSTSISKRLYATVNSSAEKVVSVKFPEINTHFVCDLDKFEKVIKQKCPMQNLGAKYELHTPELIDHNKYLESLKHDLGCLGVNTNELQEKTKAALVGFFFVMRGMCHMLTQKLVPFSLEVHSELDVGAGTGSSAAFAVAISCATLLLRKKLDNGKCVFNCPAPSLSNVNVHKLKSGFSIDELKIINQWAFCIERIMHGRPSGIDNTTCTFGSVVVASQQKTVGDLIFSILEYVPKVRILLISTGVSRNTTNLVVKVRQLREKNTAAVDAILNAIDVIAQEAFNTLEAIGKNRDKDYSCYEDIYKTLGGLMDLNHGLLRTIGVSHETLEQIVKVSNDHGLSCKLTGAGGGGYAITLVPPNFSKDEIEALKRELEPAFKVTEVNIAEEGVRLENV